VNLSEVFLAMKASTTKLRMLVMPKLLNLILKKYIPIWILAGIRQRYKKMIKWFEVW